MKPITPDEAHEYANNERISPIVIGAVNDLIKRHYANGKAVIKQDDIVDLIMQRSSFTRQGIFASRQLDFENIFREAGWIVQHDGPGFRESYPATFTFFKPIQNK